MGKARALGRCTDAAALVLIENSCEAPKHLLDGQAAD